MRAATPYVLPILALALMAAPAGGQDSSPRANDARRNRLHLDVQGIGVAVGYARTLPAGLALGGELGVGGNFLEFMLVGGRHFAEDNGIAYEDRDAGSDPLLFELFSLAAFVRPANTGRWDIDAGIRTSGFLHFDSSDDDPGGGVFAGLYGTALYGWRNVKFGPRVLVGAFTESRDRPELGLHLAFVVGRITFGW
jgi:hypothetical protein